MTETVNKKITPEIQEKLNKILGLTKEHEFKYVPKIYRETKDEDGELIFPKESWPVFKLKGKNGLEIADAEDNAGYMDIGDDKKSKLILTSGKARLETLAKHILGWNDKFVDRDGEQIKFQKDGAVVYKTSLMRMSADLQRELHEAINEQSVLTEEELTGLEY